MDHASIAEQLTNLQDAADNLLYTGGIIVPKAAVTLALDIQELVEVLRHGQRPAAAERAAPSHAPGAFSGGADNSGTHAPSAAGGGTGGRAVSGGDEPALEDLLALVRRADMAEADLDALVHECASAAASRVNNDGVAAQLTYLVGELGARDTRAVINDACGRASRSTVLLLCDACYECVTGLAAECQDGCPQALDHDGLCLRSSTPECGWCGEPGRLHEVDRGQVHARLPTVGEESDGQWFLHWPADRRGPYPSAQAAWDDWHASAGPLAPCGDHGGGPPQAQ
jgi:hypothetical protein